MYAICLKQEFYAACNIRRSFFYEHVTKTISIKVKKVCHTLVYWYFSYLCRVNL